jgi:hypothetical protein
MPPWQQTREVDGSLQEEQKQFSLTMIVYHFLVQQAGSQLGIFMGFHVFATWADWNFRSCCSSYVSYCQCSNMFIYVYCALSDNNWYAVQFYFGSSRWNVSFFLFRYQIQPNRGDNSRRIAPTPKHCHYISTNFVANLWKKHIHHILQQQLLLFEFGCDTSCSTVSHLHHIQWMQHRLPSRFTQLLFWLLVQFSRRVL